jgi:hypothetical protein
MARALTMSVPRRKPLSTSTGIRLARDRLKIEDIERLLRVVDQLVEIGWSCTAAQSSPHFLK